MLRPLKLKVQQAAAPVGPQATELPVALVWVDSAISTLVEPFSYLIPEKISSQLQIGSRVQVPFKDKHLEGLVIARQELSEIRDLKSIYKLLGDHPVASPETIELIKETARRWAGTPYDVIRSAIPARVASVEKNLDKTRSNTFSKRGNGISFNLLPPKVDPIKALLDLVLSNKSSGRKLLIVPTARDLLYLANLLDRSNIDFDSLNSNLPRAERYSNYLRICQGGAEIIIGMRSAIFAPIPNLVTIYLHDESSEHYFERRAPYWNSRDVAILRNKLADVELVLTGYLPSLATAVAIEAKEVKYIAGRSRIALLAQPSQNGELIPSKIYQKIRNELKKGPILFLVPAKGYATAISCAKCRNLAICDCGGKLVKANLKSDPTCVLCSKIYLNWKCGWCGENRIHLTSRGIERFAEEIGRSFPNIRIIQSTSLESNLQVADESAIVISTAGVEPWAANGYQLVVILQVDRFLASSAVNGVERSYSDFFHASALIGESGSVAMVCEDGQAITSAIASWNPATIAKREIELRKELALPPFTSAVQVLGEESELARLKRAFESAIKEQRAPASLKIYGPSEGDNDQFKLTMLATNSEQGALIDLLREVNKRRGISKKSLFSYRVNPFTIN